DGVLVAKKGLKDTTISIKARAVKDGGFHVVEVSDLLLEGCVDCLRAADEADRAQAVAVLARILLGALHDLRVVREAKVVVGAKVDDGLGGALDLDHGRLRGGDHTLALASRIVRTTPSYERDGTLKVPAALISSS